MSSNELPDHYFTTNQAFTKKVYRDVYPAVDPKLPMLSQSGRVIMVTGASRGVGVGIAEAFALAGAKAIIITARKIPDLKDTETKIKRANSDVEVWPVALEITDEAAVKVVFLDVADKFGKVDVLVNNAGVFKSEDKSIASEDIGPWWADFVCP